jgi:hypothetical protein
MDEKWMNQFARAILVQLHAGTCKHSLPHLDQDLFMNHPLMIIAFAWKPLYDGMNKKQCEDCKAKKKEAKIDICQKFGIELICEKNDKNIG